MATLVQDRPTRKPGITLLSMGNEALLQDQDQHAVHVLNSTAQYIWELCDGDHTLADMEQALRTHFALSSDRDIMPDIERTVRTFAEKNLLEDL